MPVLGNLFGTTRRVALAMGKEDLTGLRELGELLAFLKEPTPPAGFRDAWQQLPVFKKVMNMAPKEVKKAPCQDIVIEGNAVDLTSIPVQTCWPGDAAPAWRDPPRAASSTLAYDRRNRPATRRRA